MLLRTRDTTHQVIVVLVVLALAAVAWTASLSSSVDGGHVHSGAPAGLSTFLVAWLVMTAAMMLPTTLPMLTTYSQLVRRQRRATSKLLLFVSGYAAAWSGFGVVAFVANLLLQQLADASVFLAAHTSLIGCGVLALAAVYQFTPLKRHCLRQCRSALSFLMNAWRDGAVGAWLMGAHHGLFCGGCCWALMLVMFALGTSQLGWMLVLTLVMFIEKVVRGGEMIGRITASGLLAGAVFLVGGSVA